MFMRPEFNLTQDIHSLTEFKRNTGSLLEQLRKSGRPLILTINGRAELVVCDAAAYQELMDRVEAIEGIRRGLEEARAGKTRPAADAFRDIEARHGIKH